jgi:hypothetical protein
MTMTTATRGKTRAEVDGGRFGAGLVRARQSRATGESAERASTALVSAEVFRLDLAEKGEDVLGGARDEDPPPRFPASVTLGADESRPRDFRTMTVREVNEAMERAMRNEPVVMSRTGVLGDVSSRYAADRDPGLEQEWDFKRLAEMAGEGVWECYVCPSREHKFMVCDDDKNSHGSYYHVREPQVEKMQCKFKDFVQCAQTWREKSILFDAKLLDGSASAKSSESFVPSTKRFDGRCSEGLVRSIQQGIKWKWLDSFIRSQRCDGVESVRLIAGHRDGLQPARYILDDSIQLQVNGRRRVLLIPPACSFKGMYPYPVAHPYDGYSMVDFDDVDYGQTPAFNAVRGVSYILEPGDLLFIPRGWWRHEQGLTKEHIEIDIRLSSVKRARDPHASALLASRRIEERLAKIEGIQHIKHWLKIIAEAEDANWIDLSTVKGHKRIVMAQMVRDEIDLTLGRGSWQQVLRTMLDGRLDPTPWLNISFREPLYLSDKPVQVPDTRTDIEREFPEFFVAKLKGEGYDVDYTPVSVFNPHHPETIAQARST